jgi:hypothetical protein
MMCVSCRCGEIHDDHGDPRHLTIEDLEQAAEAAHLTVDQVVQNIQASVRHSQRPAGERQAAERAPGGPRSEAGASDDTLPLGESTAGLPQE